MRVCLFLPVLAAFWSGCSHPPSSESQTSPPGVTVLSPSALENAKHHVDFTAHVKPILEARCVMCHNRKTLPGRLSLESRRRALTSKPPGPYIIPGDPAHSRLIAGIQADHAHLTAMPPVGERITKDELIVLRKWIKDGAAWPQGRTGRLNPDWIPQE